MKDTAKLLKYRGKPLSDFEQSHVLADLMTDLAAGNVTPAEASKIIKELERPVKELVAKNRALAAFIRQRRKAGA